MLDQFRLLNEKNMAKSHPASRLTRIATIWTMIRDAHCETDSRFVAQTEFFERYQRAIEKYLLAVLKDANAAEEVFSKFAEDFLSGKFQNVDASKGKFRHYLKRSLINAAYAYRRKNSKALPNVDASEVIAESETEHFSDEFDGAWRQELLDKTWVALQEKDAGSNSNYYTILRLRVDHPEWNGSELLDSVRSALRKPNYPDATFRKDLKRARDRFAQYLIQEIGRSIGTRSLDAIEDEAIVCGLHSYCKSMIDKLRNQSEH